MVPEIHETALVDDSDIGESTVVWAYSNVYECTIGEECMIGPFVEIQADAQVGDNVSIQSHSFICADMIIKDGVWIGHGVQTVNNLYPPGEPPWDPPIVHENAVVGTNATLMPVEIGENAVVGAGAVVTKDVPPNTTVVGNPARPVQEKEGRTW